ncbi:unnamed protein product [Ilex paraguariensis]|uniref:Uncharacterized protein n=1 Tax=Ilex paraguariensis TaxID=185542 RepID=A0ABC8RWC3_9AQUA
MQAGLRACETHHYLSHSLCSVVTQDKHAARLLAGRIEVLLQSTIQPIKCKKYSRITQRTLLVCFLLARKERRAIRGLYWRDPTVNNCPKEKPPGSPRTFSTVLYPRTSSLCSKQDHPCPFPFSIPPPSF